MLFVLPIVCTVGVFITRILLSRNYLGLDIGLYHKNTPHFVAFKFSKLSLL
jgi:uncharacterized membrane protein